MLRYRATTSTGAVVDDPSSGQLADLVAEVDRSGRQGFLFLERRGPARGVSYLQACRDLAGWLLELRDGGPARHFEARVGDTAVVSSTLASWTQGARAWRGLDWEIRGRRDQRSAPRLARAV